MEVVSLESVESANDVPVLESDSHAHIEFSGTPGVSRYRLSCPRGASLDALLVNKQSDTLVVALHGATLRTKFELPRFEWFRTLRRTEYSSLYFSDPTLCLDEDLQLAWYTGWLEWDAIPLIVSSIRNAIVATDSKLAVVLGSSGGGFAAMQIASQISGAVAIPFNAQTNIGSYLVQGRSLSAQRRYMSVVMPSLTPSVGLDRLETGKDYFKSLGERSSVIERYSRRRESAIYYVQNVNDYPHMEQHYRPFRKAIEEGPNKDRVTFDLYEGPESHNPPSQAVFHKSIERALTWRRTLDMPSEQMNRESPRA